jgi:hypothetical protein
MSHKDRLRKNPDVESVIPVPSKTKFAESISLSFGSDVLQYHIGCVTLKLFLVLSVRCQPRYNEQLAVITYAIKAQTIQTSSTYTQVKIRRSM